ncbi:reverse transcriptase domain-containing protein [Tanacetum coccineum]
MLPISFTVDLCTLPSISISDKQKAETNETTDVYKEEQEMEEDMAKTNLHQIGIHDVLFDFASCFDMTRYISVAATVTHAASTQEETNLGSNSSQNKTYNYKELCVVMHENFCGTEGAVGLTRWFEKLESQFGISNVAEGDRVKFASSTLLDGALTWWNVYVRSVTLDTAHATPWSDFKAMFIRKYCPRNEVKQMENELWNLKVKGTNLTAYNQRFQELILLCPEMVPNTDRLLECYIEGLPLNIKGNVTSSKPVDLHEAIEMAQGLMYQVVQELGENSGDKRKWNGNHYNNNNPNNTGNLNPNKRPETIRVFTAGKGCIREMSQSLSNNVPDNSPEQEAATGHSTPRRLNSPTPQATQFPELELTLTPAIGRELSHEINNHSVPTLTSQAPGPSRKRSRSPSSPFFPDDITFSDGKPASETSELNPEDVTARLEDLEVEIDTLHADTEDKELLIPNCRILRSCPPKNIFSNIADKCS